jgi:hypothetical protein
MEDEIRRMLRDKSSTVVAPSDVPPELLRRARRARSWGALVTLVATTGALVGAVIAFGAIRPVRENPPETGRPDFRILASIEVEAGAVAVGPDAVWVVGGSRVHRVDPSRNQIVASLDVHQYDPFLPANLTSIAVTGNSVFATGSSHFLAQPEGSLITIDASTNQIVRAVVIPNVRPAQVAVAAGSVWLVDRAKSQVIRVDPRTGFILARLALLGKAIAADDTALWIAVGSGQVVRVDPRTNRVVARVSLDIAFDIFVGDGGVWVSRGPDDVAFIDPRSNRLARSFSDPSRVSLLQLAGVRSGVVWAGDGSGEHLVRVDLARFPEATQLSLPGIIADLALGDDAVWVVTGKQLLRVGPAD